MMSYDFSIEIITNHNHLLDQRSFLLQLREATLIGLIGYDEL
jgi:hypothetical protein